MEGLESVYSRFALSFRFIKNLDNDVSPSAPSTSRADPRATYIAEQMTPKTVHLSKMPTKPYSGIFLFFIAFNFTFILFRLQKTCFSSKQISTNSGNGSSSS